MRYWPASDVLWCAIDETSIVLCLDTNTFHHFNKSAALIWAHITQGADHRELVQRLSERFPTVPVLTLERDVSNVLEGLAERSLITTESAARGLVQDWLSAKPRAVDGNPVTRMPATLMVVTMLVLIRASILLLGLRSTLSWLARLDSNSVRPLRKADLIASARAVAFAAPLSPLRAECLERALCLLWALRKRGGAVSLHFGVRPHPFSAHAWLETDGEPLNDHPEHVKTFVPLGRTEVLP